MKKVIVISLGGSLIAQKKIDYSFLNSFKKTLTSDKEHKFAVVCGGGTKARERITLLKKQKKSVKEQSLAGIKATRENAQSMMKFFDKKANKVLPKSKREVRSFLKKHDIVFCGALRYSKDETSDGTAAKLARYLKAELINMTNVKGLYTSNPKEDKTAKFIPRISWREFERIALRIKYAPGQHFVLDQNAAKLIRKHKIKTIILGKDNKNLSNLLKGKKFTGTIIDDANSLRTHKNASYSTNI